MPGLKFRNPFKKKARNQGQGQGPQPQDFGGNAANQANIGGAQGGDQGVMAMVGRVPTKKTRNSVKRKNRNKPGHVAGDKKVKDKHLRGGMRSLGGGTANDVYKVKYDRQIGSSGTNEGFWKATGAHGRAASMASSRLDQALGTNMISQDIEAEHTSTSTVVDAGGDYEETSKKMGITSGLVKGEALKDSKYEDVTDQLAGAYGEDYAGLKALLAGPGMGGKRLDEENQRIEQYVGDELLDADFSHPETQRGMANLQLLDYLTAQRDRHEGNIFIDPDTGKVSGIDNDLSFGEGEDRDNFVKGGVGGDKVEGMPQQVDAQLGLRVLFMTEAEFLKILEGHKDDSAHLSNEAKEAALDRLRALKDHIDDLYMNDELVHQWTDDTYDEAVASGNGYLARAVAARQDNAEDVV